MVFSPLIANRLRETDNLLFLLTEHIEKTRHIKKNEGDGCQ